MAIDPKSIAVLAFADMSAGKDKEYFADGVAEEILNALAKVADLKVAGRTSSFYFKDKNEKIQTIGRMLGVAHVLDGSVRQQGDRVRITAQLIHVDSGFNLWSDNFDGSLGDVFELQEKIARSVAMALRVVLGADQQRRPTKQKNVIFSLFTRASKFCEFQHPAKRSPDDSAKAGLAAQWQWGGLALVNAALPVAVGPSRV